MVIVSKKNQKKAEEIRKFLKIRGYKDTSHANIMKMKTEKEEFRVKFQKNSIRLEKKLPLEGSAKSTWIKLRSGFYRDITISEKGIKGLKR